MPEVQKPLQSVFLKEPFLNRVQLAVLFQTLDRQYLAPVAWAANTNRT